METQKEINQIQIATKYIDTLLETGKPPTSIYILCKSLEIDESSFYKYFSSLGHLEKKIFILFFENAITVLEENDDYATYDSKNKLLSLYFTYFEILTQNRSFVLLSLNDNKNSLKSIKKLEGLKSIFNKFLKDLHIDKIDFKQEKIEKVQDKGIQEGFWIQFLMILKFWMNDTSSSFEKTDVFIEKSIHASFDLLDTKPLKSIIDLGKFLFKEKMNSKF
jgi:hypothetical protein